MATPPTPSNRAPASIFHILLIVERIPLALPSPADVARVAPVSRTCFDEACSSGVLKNYPKPKQQALLGLYFPRPILSPLGVMFFQSASAAMSDPALAKFLNRRSKQLPDILEGDPNWYPLDCRDGRLLLGKARRRMVYDTTFGRCVAEFPQCYLGESHANTIAECLLQGYGDDGESFRVVCLQRRHRGDGLRAVGYSSDTRGWQSYWWQNHLKKPEVFQAMQGGSRRYRGW